MTYAWGDWEGSTVGGKYHLKKYLGGSDQGAVFCTEDGSGQTEPVAIKLVRSDVANTDPRLDQWRLAEGLSHPNLLRILQTGSGQWNSISLIFVVMEYAEENLAQILPERRLTGAEACQLLEPTLSALVYLHGRGLVHGGLRPGNIMASKDQLKLASDRVCKVGEPYLNARSPYDPPDKTDAKTSPAGDIWSLGITLVEILTQRLPTWNENDQDDPGVTGEIPAPLFDIVRGCLRRDPGRRLTIPEIQSRLRFPVAPKSSSPVFSVPEPRPATPPDKAIKRHLTPRVVITALGIIALVVIVGLCLGPPANHPDAATKTGRSQQPEQKADPHSASSVSQVVAAPRNKPSPTSSRSPTPPSSKAIDRRPGDSQAARRVMPEVSQAALDTIQGTVKVNVRVRVDRSGNVVGAEFESSGPSKYFARQSMQAAQSWRFAEGPDDSRQFVLRFEFTNSGVKADAMATVR